MPKTTVWALAAVLLATFGCSEIKARRLIQEGNKAYQAEKYDVAVAKFEAALALEPKLATGWFNLAIAHIDAFKPGDKTPANEAHADKALAALNKYIELQPADETAVKLLIGTYTRSGRWQGALDFYTREYEKKPTDAFVIFNLADISEQAGRFEESRQWFTKLAETEPSTDAKATAWYRVGVSYFKQMKTIPAGPNEKRVNLADQGIAALAKAAQLQPENTNILTYSGILYRQRAAGQGKSYYAVVDLATAGDHQVKVKALKDKQAALKPPSPVPGQAPAPAGNQKKQ